MKRLYLILGLAIVALSATHLFAKYEKEQLQIETQLQNRIEGILGKTLPANSYLVTVKVEVEDRERPIASSVRRPGSNSLVGKNQYVLPGVPGKKEFVAANDSEESVSGFSVETMVRKITISILVAPNVTAEQIRTIREVITASIPFNPLRGDEMQIQNSSLLKSPSDGVSAGAGESDGGNIWKTIFSRSNLPLAVVTAILLLVLGLFVVFLFGPMRAFLNRLLTVLPRVGEQAAYTVSNAPSKNGSSNPLGLNGYGSNGNGSHDPENETLRPFRFIREDQLNKLPILCQSLSPAQCALILAYLPAEWASKLLGTLDPAVQTTVMRELSQAREVPAAIVKELEEQVKTKLPYLVGGSEWIQSVYQLTQPQVQRNLLGTLNQQSPELAQALRRKTFFLEDIMAIAPGALRLLLQEAGYPTVASALRDEKPEVREALLKRLPVAMKEVLQQELDLAADDKTAMADAKVKLLEMGRKLLMEGRIALPERK